MRSKNAFSSILTLLLCLSLIIGMTYALLTSKSETNISINSGKVEVIATVTDLALYSHKDINIDDPTIAEKIDVVGNTFPNMGTAKYADGTLTLDRITPGDGVTFNISITNNSNVAIKYRTVISDITGSSFLMDALNVKIGDTEYYGAVTGEWISLDAEGAIASIPVSIELPTTAGNEYRDLDVSISITVEAIQGNAVENVATVGGVAYETFTEAIAAAQSGDIIEVTDGAIVQMPASVADGVTIKNATFNTPVTITNTTAATIADGEEATEATEAAPVVFDSCTFRGNALLSVDNRDVKVTNCTFVDTAAGASATGDMPYIYQASGESTVTVENTTAEVTVYTADKWVEMAKALNTLDDQSYLTLKLGANLDFTGVTGYQISNLTTTLDGQGYTVSNLDGVGLFGTISGEVMNLNLKGVTSIDNSQFASFAYTVSGKVTKCNVSDVDITVTFANYGGAVAGFVQTVKEGAVIDGCKVSDVTINLTDATNNCSDGEGGVIGGVEAGATVQNCEFTNITLSAAGRIKRGGGIFGSVSGKVLGCTVNNVSLITTRNTDQAGGFAGIVNGGAEITDCVLNNVTVDGGKMGSNVGGLFGKVGISGSTAITLKNITTNGLTLTLGNSKNNCSNIGGFIGQADFRASEHALTVDNCHISGLDMTLELKSNGESPSAGFISSLNANANITNCSVSGKIDGTGEPVGVGGFLGDIGGYGHSGSEYTVNIKDCKANVAITEAEGTMVGGFVSYAGSYRQNMALELTFTNCEATGSFYGVVESGTNEVSTFTGCKVNGTAFTYTAPAVEE